MPTRLSLSSMKKSLHMKNLLIALFCLVFDGFELSSGARILLPENPNNLLFVGPENPSSSTFDPHLRVVVAGTDTSAHFNDHHHKTELECQELQMNPSTKKEDNLTFRFCENRAGDVAEKEEEVVYSVQLKGNVSPSGASHRGNALINGQQLSKSKPSPAVGHMQIYHPAKSRLKESSGVKQQRGVSEKRVLKSTPSPGAGH